MFTYLFGWFLRRVFSLLRDDGILYIHNALAWRHRSFLSKILSPFFPRSLDPRFRVLSRRPHLQNSSSPGAWHETPFTATSVPKVIFFTPISADGRRGLFPLWDSLGLLYVPIPHSLPIRSQSAIICWFQFWPGFVTSGLTYIAIPLLIVILWRPDNSNTEG